MIIAQTSLIVQFAFFFMAEFAEYVWFIRRCANSPPVSLGGVTFFLVDLVERLLGTPVNLSVSCGGALAGFVCGMKWSLARGGR